MVGGVWTHFERVQPAAVVAACVGFPGVGVDEVFDARLGFIEDSEIERCGNPARGACRNVVRLGMMFGNDAAPLSCSGAVGLQEWYTG